MEIDQNIGALERLKYYPLLLMLVVTFFLAADALVYRLVLLDHIVLTGGTLILPITYLIYDIITEVYGYDIGRRTIWYVLLCNLIFTILTLFVIHLPVPKYWHLATAYKSVFDPLIRLEISSTVGMLLGSFINIYVISKWKILVKGKHLWIRMIGSSAIGEAALSVVGFEIALGGVIPFSKLLLIMGAAWLYKAIFTAIGAYPAALFSTFLKKREKMDIYDIDTNFNPFKL